MGFFSSVESSKVENALRTATFLTKSTIGNWTFFFLAFCIIYCAVHPDLLFDYVNWLLYPFLRSFFFNTHWQRLYHTVVQLQLNYSKAIQCQHIFLNIIFVPFQCWDDCTVSTSINKSILATWSLGVTSMVRENSLVSANIAWESQNSPSDCLVTWEVSGGGLIGNLLTQSSNVELSLWPDTKYRVQVTCKNKVGSF